MLLNNEEIKNILKKNVFLDAGAAKELIKKGFCSLIGVSELKKNKCVVSSEILHTEKRTDGSDVIVPSRISGNRWFEATLSGAGVLSSFVIPSGEKYPGLVRFQNTLGGQIYIYCAENDFGDAFYSNYRIKLLKKICNDICPDIITVDFNAYGSVVVRKLEDKTAVFVANLSADSIDNLIMSIPKTAKSARLITSAGETKQIEFKDDKICLDGKMQIYDFGVILFS